MDNLVLITSVADIPNNPWSYSKVRSVYSREERFQQLKLTTESAILKIPNSKLMLIECSNFTHEETNYINSKYDYIINLIENYDLHKYIFSNSKSLGFGIMIMEGIKYLQKHNLNFKHFIKMGGRYWLNDNFNYKEWDNDKIVVKKINNNPNNIQVGYFKIPYNLMNNLYIFLNNNINKMINCIGFEVLFSEFVNNNNQNVKYINTIGMEGYVSVCGSYWCG